MIRNLVITGVGGQGVKLLSTLLRRAIGRKFVRFSGYDDRGGAQRYGPVASVVRFSDAPSYQGPLAIDFPDGSAHWILALEASEPLRFNAKIGPTTVVLADTLVVPPTNVRREDGDYFTCEALADHYRSLGCTLHMADFRGLARTLTGNPIDANLLLLGTFLRHCDELLTPTDLEDLADARQMDVIRHGWGSNE